MSSHVKLEAFCPAKTLCFDLVLSGYIRKIPDENLLHSESEEPSVLCLKDNLREDIYEENGHENFIDAPVSDIAIWDNTERAHKLLVDTVENPKTPKQLTLFKISSTPSEAKTDVLLDIIYGGYFRKVLLQ
ncbi:hypothetical protein TNCV_3090651 [Trichonephila clavipes]|uniref:Uncharacterized protein n=1 Tax=Trichonephila clavipes TaxID=2585209 RepID=A0A8X6W890_TRICX|nr:hypothetical protein TNCV_3090651 [Trichonephila clavipes]